MLELQAIGNLGQTAKVIEWNGEKFISFDLAITEKFKNSSNEQVKRVTWISCSMVYRASVIEFLEKGKKVYVRGSVSVDQWMSGNDTKAGLKLKVRSFELC